MNNSNNQTLLMLSGQCEIRKALTGENIAYAAGMVTILLASVIGNSLVITAVTFSNLLRNRVTILLVLSLAFSDLLNAVTQIPFHISTKFHQRFCYNLSTCYFQQLTDVICNAISILSLFAIAIERFIAVKFAYQYQSIFSHKRTKLIITAIWIFSLVWAMIGVRSWSNNGSLSIMLMNNQCRNVNRIYFAIGFVGIFLLPLATMTVTYLIILRVALQHIKSIEASRIELNPFLNNNTTNEDCQESLKKSKRMRKQRQRKRELKATKSLAIVYCAFTLCWLPNCVINIILMFDKNYFHEIKTSNSILFNFIVYTFIQILPMINTMVNPIIYSFSSEQFRLGFKDVFKRMINKLELNGDFLEGRRETRSTLDGVSPQFTPRVSTVESIKQFTHKTSTNNSSPLLCT